MKAMLLKKRCLLLIQFVGSAGLWHQESGKLLRNQHKAPWFNRFKCRRQRIGPLRRDCCLPASKGSAIASAVTRL